MLCLEVFSRTPAPGCRPEGVEPCLVLHGKISNWRAETLYRLFEKGHAAVAPLRKPKLILHSNLPHLLGSVYFLGAGVEQLKELYEYEIQTLVPIDETLVRMLLESLINGFIGGFGHPFIHLPYTWKLQSPAVATEALSLGCTEYTELHGLLDQYPPGSSTYKSTSLVDIIKRVHDDNRFDDLFTNPGIANMGPLLQNRFEALLEHWNAWQTTDPLQQLEQCCDVFVLLGIGIGDRERKFDFFLIHTMTLQRACILRQYALFVIIVYICQLRLVFDVDIIDSIPVELSDDCDWKAMVDQALKHKRLRDSNFFEVFRAPREFEETYGKRDDLYLKAAVKFPTEFELGEIWTRYRGLFTDSRWV
ncbi:questin oxidase family protein [Aspergillus glaucus CBS 516.65]|uniref:Uncharacterized protein n=1 Tax=Aspergillus glaucus CBS 516.65 TaxID=1160497 RepID=A0A1L9VR95_ASPGL|nr:hypothetical protein ASPGLDRAFT_64698 [Aspergillus glaucus CBS 516.65]OJJ86404.1 hypothetical protein ASPGLDRAFT_64698 [Aspergillus glaucus CBS 516.65]